MNESAIKYQKEEYKKETLRYKEETDEEKAYRILNIPPATTNDQIKRAYRTHTSIWHPDAKTVKDDTKIKEINWAYEVLRNKRKFT